MTKEKLQEYARTMQIAINEKESEIMLEQINDILDYVSSLDDFDSEERKSINFNEDNCNEFNCNRFREDIVLNSISVSEALKNAPNKNENFFKVPKVIE